MDCSKKVSIHTWSGPFWLIGWLFTVGFAPLSGWKILFALVVWPYYIGQIVAKATGIGGQ